MPFALSSSTAAVIFGWSGASMAIAWQSAKVLVLAGTFGRLGIVEPVLPPLTRSLDRQRRSRRSSRSRPSAKMGGYVDERKHSAPSTHYLRSSQHSGVLVDLR